MKFSITFSKKAGDFMKISALIAEFNPFHAGHKLLIDHMRQESDGIIAIMSGNFVQRGECSIYKKAERCRAALKNGVDLVLELPAVFALSSAEGFAKGGVKILDACKVVDTLWFGSECGDIDALKTLADILNEESPFFRKELDKKLSLGASFPAARTFALSKMGADASVLKSPNTILAVEYIRALKSIHSDIKPVTIKRIGAGYNEKSCTGEIPSASFMRSLIQNGEDADKYMLYNYESTPLFMKNFNAFIALRLKTASVQELCLLPDCNEELAVRLKKASYLNTFDEIVSAVSTRRYTQSRIRRILCNLLINNCFKTLPEPTYIRPLGFSEKGGKILKEMKKTASLPIRTRGGAIKDDNIFLLECQSTDVYNLAHAVEGGEEFRFSPIRV